MSIYLGNIKWAEVEAKLGYRLPESDKATWDKYHTDQADLSKSGKQNCFHVFDIPREIHFKGKETGEAIKAMFTSDKMVKVMGLIHVCQIPD